MRDSVRGSLEAERTSLVQAEREAAEGEKQLAEQLRPYHNGSPYPETRELVDVLQRLHNHWRKHRAEIRARISRIDERTRARD